MSDVQKPPDPPMVPFALGGIGAFALGWLAVWLADGPSAWRDICLAGVLWGLLGLAVMTVHDRRRRSS